MRITSFIFILGVGRDSMEVIDKAEKECHNLISLDKNLNAFLETQRETTN